VSGDEDRDVSEVISDDIHKREEETVEKEDEKSEKVSEESSVNSPGKGVVDRLKDAYGSWFGKSVENQSTPQGGEGLSKSKDSGSEVEQVSKAEGEKRLQE
ncbi:hypothetical protein, partial [Escherichia coli]|uniref:hypothetical protein n=1 Tax=Escherichia coli TaxID=562 RepID=UPI0019579D30